MEKAETLADRLRLQTQVGYELILAGQPDEAVATLLDVGFVKGVVWGDYNNEGRLDLYLSRPQEPNVLYRNDGLAEGALERQSIPTVLDASFSPRKCDLCKIRP
jgi:hypothetical protein